MDLAIEKAGEQGIDEIVLAMAHRGRLNVLANIMGKSPQQIFREFADIDPELHLGRGDVKYHLGHSTRLDHHGGRTACICRCASTPAIWSSSTRWRSAACGPSRIVSDDSQRRRGLVLLIHGDAAFAGEGIMQETLNLSQLAGYTDRRHAARRRQQPDRLHDQPCEGRSSTYATDVAKMLQIPIFHVNGEDPEAVAQVVRLAMDFRREFQRDVVIDMYCYRRRGHNEGDEPAFTQPVMYRAIEKRKSVREGYLDRLAEAGRNHARGGRQMIADQQREQAGAGAVGRQERRLRAIGAISPASGRFTSAAASARRPKSKPA